MKKNLCLFLAVVLALALIAPVFVEEAEAETVQVTEDAVPLGDAPEEVDTISADPAEVPLEPVNVPDPTDVPAPVVTDAPVVETTEEPTPVVTDAPVPEVTEAPAPEVTEAPAPETTEAPADEPEATEEPAGDQGIALASLDPMDGEPEKVTVVTLDPNGGTFPYEIDQTRGYIKIELKGDDRTLHFADAEDRAPQREGYKFKGWFTGANDGTEVPLESAIPAEFETLYAQWERIPRTIALHVMNGNFTGSWPAVENLSDKPSVDVALTGDDLLPDVSSLNPVRSHGSFAGWYTEPATEELKSEEGGFGYWHTVEVKGQKVDANTKVPEGVSVLYAVFNDTDTVQESDKRVTIYLDWNGINGLWGKCLTLTRTYDAAQGGYVLQAEDLAVWGLNWNGDDNADGRSKFPDQQSLTNYWAENQFNGYTFKGWATSPEKTEPDVVAGETKVTNGQSIYAVWAMVDGSASSDTFDRTDKEAGPLQSMNVTSANGGRTASSMDWNAHLNKDSSVTFYISRTPSRATFKEVTWTVSDGKRSVTVEYNASNPVPVTKQLSDKISLTASGINLTVQYIGEKTDKDTVIVTVNAQVENQDGSVINNKGLAARAVFAHTWQQTAHQDATCTKAGYTDYSCSCGETKHEVLPEGHTKDVYYRIQATCTEPGYDVYVCQRCKAELKRVKIREPLGHNYVTTVTKKATCTDAGSKEVRCSRCGDSRTEVIPATGHNTYTRTISSCEGSVTEKICYTCGTTTVVGRDPNGASHVWEGRRTDKEATCTTQGSSSIHCSRCGVVKDSQVIPINASAHSWGGWKETRPATLNATGVKEHTCTRCGAVESSSIPKATWVRSGRNWYYYSNNVPVTGFVENNSYYMASNGVMQTGWINLGGTWYYANGSGLILKNQWFKSGRTWYWLAADGKMATGGPVNVGGADYFFTGSGAMITGWINVGNGNWYYASGSGAVIRNQWLKSGRTWYWLKANGLMAAGGLERIGGADYFFNGSGAMLTGWINLGGGNYMYANGSGAIVKNQWVKCGRAWYYLKSDGMMARNEYVGSYWVNNAGVWV